MGLAQRWPNPEWTLAKEQIPQHRRESFESYAFVHPRPEKQNGIRTNAILAIRRGEVVYEKYRAPWNKDRAHLAWSVAKMLTNALTAIAVSEQRLSLDTPIVNYYQGMDPRLRVHHLLEWRSCLDFTETYEDAPYEHSNVLAMLYGTGRYDTALYVSRLSQSCPPGDRFSYSSGDTNLLMGVLKKVYPGEANIYPWQKIFYPLDMKSATFEQDLSGTFLASSYLYLTARDLARFGYLYLRNGTWNNQQIIEPKWVKESFATGHAEIDETGRITNVGGRSLWLNVHDGFSPHPGWPKDMVYSRGHWGQYLIVVPSWDLVVVRFADERNRSVFNLSEFGLKVRQLLGLK